MEQELKNIFSQFFPNKKVVSFEEIGSGHINDTYKVLTEDKSFLLQRLNHNVFKNVKGLTQNLIKVYAFLKSKIEKEDIDFQVAALFPGQTGECLIKYADNYWRLFEFIENAKTYEHVSNVSLALQGGIAYGKFTQLLSDFPSEEFIETIPHFHHAKSRINEFKKAIENTLKGRVEEIKKLIDELLGRENSMMLLYDLAEKGEIPQRITHNDTKISNILFDESGKGICVIDLDTVMPGYIPHDFGDAIRTFTNTAAEDESDLNKISMNMGLFKAFTKGFLSETKEILSKNEISLLVFGAKYIVYEQTIRFLGDYLNGDVYYKIDYPEHNLVRARAQFQLLKSIEIQEEEMDSIISKLVEGV